MRVKSHMGKVSEGNTSGGEIHDCYMHKNVISEGKSHEIHNFNIHKVEIYDGFMHKGVFHSGGGWHP